MKKRSLSIALSAILFSSCGETETSKRYDVAVFREYIGREYRNDGIASKEIHPVRCVVSNVPETVADLAGEAELKRIQGIEEPTATQRLVRRLYGPGGIEELILTAQQGRFQGQEVVGILERNENGESDSRLRGVCK